MDGNGTRSYYSGSRHREEVWLFRSPSGSWIVEVFGDGVESFDEDQRGYDRALEYYDSRVNELAAKGGDGG